MQASVLELEFRVKTGIKRLVVKYLKKKERQIAISYISKDG